MDVRAAIKSRVAARFAPAKERIDRLRVALAAFEAAELSVVTTQVERDVFKALAAELEADDAAASTARVKALDELRAAVKALLPSTLQKRAATDAEKKRADELRAELDTAAASTTSPGRLIFVLRAIAAESRAMMVVLQVSDPVFLALVDLLDAVLLVRREHNVVGFVPGLSLGQMAGENWAELSVAARERLSMFDEAAARVKPLALVSGKRR